MSEWQPIETAPKDGSEFIACWGWQGNAMQFVRFDPARKLWLSKGEVIAGFLHNATEWTARPQPPPPPST